MVPAFGPIRQQDLIRCLRKAGFKGPFSGGRHPFMEKGNLTLTIPNAHDKEIGRDLLSKIMRQAGISREEWEKL